MIAFNTRSAFLALIVFIASTVVFFSCSKELSVESKALPAGNTAIGTLKDTAGNCLPIIVKGTYYNGVVPGDTNYIQITVDVKTAGSFTIQTGLQNGFQFAGTGIFNSTGIQTINLKASGTPSQIIPTDFTLSFDSSACAFTVNVQDSTGHGLGGGGVTDTSGIALNQWQFVANGHTYSGNVGTASFTDLISGNLTVVGTMASGSPDTAFGITVQFPGATLDTGTYATSDAGTNFSLTIVQSGNIIYAANATSVPPVLNITITNYNSGTKTVTGIFSGQAYDFNGNNLAVTNGEFKAQLQ
jgi:hypothetical protein